MASREDLLERSALSLVSRALARAAVLVSEARSPAPTPPAQEMKRWDGGLDVPPLSTEAMR